MRKKEERSSSVKAIRLLADIDKGYLFYSIVGGALSALVIYVPIILLGEVADAIVYGQGLGQVAVLIMTGLTAGLVFQLAQAWIEKKKALKGNQISMYFETLVSRSTMHMSYADLESDRTRELQARIQADRSWGSGFFGITGKVQELVQQVSDILIAVLVLVPLAAAIIRERQYWLGGVIGFNVLLAIFCSSVYVRRYNKKESQAMQEMTQTEKGSRFHYMDDGGGAINYQALKDIRMYDAVGLIRRTLEEEKRAVRFHTDRISGINAGNGALKGMFRGVLMGVSYCAVATAALAGWITIGMVIQYAQAICNLCGNLMRLIQLVGEFGTDADRLASTMEYLRYGEKKLSDGKPVPGLGEYKIEFRDVSFSYPGSTNPALRHVDFEMKKGDRVALVGENGSGKTTLVKLLCRLYEPDEGEILVNGRNISEYGLASWQDQLSVVFQDFSLMSFGIYQNIAAGNGYDPVKVSKAARTAGLEDMLEKMPEGGETAIYKDYEENGVEISGGEAQKIAIARAIYKDAPVVVMDEPTAALDPLAEYQVYTGFDRLAGDKGIIYVSHRLSSCRFCNRILVMDHGKVVENGSHEELLERGEHYARLWNAQAQYYSK